jgi:hypothetical protein
MFLHQLLLLLLLLLFLLLLLLRLPPLDLEGYVYLYQNLLL